MKSLVYRGPGVIVQEERARPVLQEPGDAIVRMLKTTICGTDLHILQGGRAGVSDGWAHSWPRRHRYGHRGGRGRGRLQVQRGDRVTNLLYNCLRRMRDTAKSERCIPTAQLAAGSSVTQSMARRRSTSVSLTQT